MSKEAKVGYKKNIGTILCYLLPAQLFMDCHIFDHITAMMYQAMYHLTNTQMGLLGSAHGVLGVFLYYRCEAGR